MRLSTTTTILSASFCTAVVEGFVSPGRHGGVRRSPPAFRPPPSTSSPLSSSPAFGVTTAAHGRRTTAHHSITTERTSTLHDVQNVTDGPPSLHDESFDDDDDDDDGDVVTTQVQKRTWNQDRIGEYVGLGAWITALSGFLLVNNYVGPWPEPFLTRTPVEYFGLTHALAGMLFGGGIVLTTLIEWLATSSRNASVLSFWFGKVPGLDAFVVLPALTASIVSGVGLSVDHYDSLGEAPFHVVAAISTLLAFAGWWAVTDLTTQEAASEAIEEWTAQQQQQQDEQSTVADVPRIVQLRKISNVVSCAFVAAIYAIMVLKPGM